MQELAGRLDTKISNIYKWRWMRVNYLKKSNQVINHEEGPLANTKQQSLDGDDVEE
jgi:hypothetical protein